MRFNVKPAGMVRVQQILNSSHDKAIAGHKSCRPKRLVIRWHAGKPSRIRSN